MGGANVVEAGLGEFIGNSANDLLVRAAEQYADVRVGVARLAGKDWG